MKRHFYLVFLFIHLCIDAKEATRFIVQHQRQKHSVFFTQTHRRLEKITVRKIPAGTTVPNKNYFEKIIMPEKPGCKDPTGRVVCGNRLETLNIIIQAAQKKYEECQKIR